MAYNTLTENEIKRFVHGNNIYVALLNSNSNIAKEALKFIENRIDNAIYSYIHNDTDKVSDAARSRREAACNYFYKCINKFIVFDPQDDKRGIMHTVYHALLEIYRFKPTSFDGVGGGGVTETNFDDVYNIIYKSMILKTSLELKSESIIDDNIILSGNFNTTLTELKLMQTNKQYKEFLQKLYQNFPDRNNISNVSGIINELYDSYVAENPEDEFLKINNELELGEFNSASDPYSVPGEVKIIKKCYEKILTYFSDYYEGSAAIVKVSNHLYEYDATVVDRKVAKIRRHIDVLNGIIETAERPRTHILNIKNKADIWEKLIDNLKKLWDSKTKKTNSDKYFVDFHDPGLAYLFKLSIRYFRKAMIEKEMILSKYGGQAVSNEFYLSVLLLNAFQTKENVATVKLYCLPLGVMTYYEELYEYLPTFDNLAKIISKQEIEIIKNFQANKLYVLKDDIRENDYLDVFRVNLKDTLKKNKNKKDFDLENIDAQTCSDNISENELSFYNKVGV